ncbi:hypothetical protein Bca52824_064533 [Brassica carinata]|uniref:Uncharacterized protein n=1 Tax=Brassica carinata TaxID=52824 RepID=A0A8X7QHQ7_BRACI|nr:hypothetical protein Bca52824_064533 [Brassica carinata]
MRRAYTNKKTGQIDDGLVRDVVDLVQTQVVGEVSQLQTEDDAGGRPTCRFESTKSLNPRFQRRRDVWSVWVIAPVGSSFFAPPPFVDPNSSSSFVNGGCCGSLEPPEIVAASPSSAAFTGALGLAVSSVEVVARAENVESRELFFIQRVLHLLETGYGSRAPHRAVCSSQALDSCCCSKRTHATADLSGAIEAGNKEDFEKYSKRTVKLHGDLEAKSLGAPGTCVAELLEAWILDGVGVEQDGREEMELVQKLEKRDR